MRFNKMTEYHPETILGTAEQITLGFNVAPDGDVNLTLMALCTPPVGPIRINITPEQAADLYRSLHGVCNLTDQQADHLADVIANATKEN
jgi:hypothetical protein